MDIDPKGTRGSSEFIKSEVEKFKKYQRPEIKGPSIRFTDVCISIEEVLHALDMFEISQNDLEMVENNLEK